jgi:hypothetical protein
MAKKVPKLIKKDNIILQDIDSITKFAKKVPKFINYNKNKEMVWTIAFMILLFVALFGTSALFKSFNHFTYKGLSFTKEKFGTIPVYHYYYYFTDSNTGKQYQYNLYLRIDPRKNNVSMPLGETEFSKEAINYLTVNGSGLTSCTTSARDLGSLAELFSANMLPMKAGTMDSIEAKSNNLTYITCDNKPANPVIQIFSGNETKITIDHNCYNIQIANCQTLEAIEKFKLQTILDAKARSLNQTNN